MRAAFASVSLLCVLLSASASNAADEAEKAATALEAYKASTPPEKVAALFTEFCRTHFGAEKEPLVYETFGKQLLIQKEGSWSHASVNSACLAWETNLPATTHVEYGETKAYGHATEKTERPFYIHVHYLRDLKPGTTYHYRFVCRDERGNKIDSGALTFTTRNAETGIPVPGDLPGPPYKLDKKDTTYVVTRDFTAEHTAIEIHAPGITLDLGGRTVTYADVKVPKETFTDKWMSYTHKGSFGIKNIGHSGVKLINGTIRQGRGDNRGNNESTGFNAVYLRKLKDIEMAGVTLDYWTPQIAGARLRYCEGRMLIHHCVFFDRGNKMHNRHGQGCSTYSPIGCKFTDSTIHHCLVKRTRQNGLRPKHKLYNNEIYVDSWATNSFASGVGSGGASHHNRIFCTGYHAISCPWGDGIKVHDNFIHMEGINTGRTRWWEGFGDQNSMNGLRHTQWGKNRSRSENSEYANNVVVIKGRHGAQIRGVEFFADPYIRNLVLRDSIIKVEARDEKTSKATCVATHGNPRRRDMHLPVTYRNCRFISNINNLRLGDDYGRGDNHYFIECAFERIGNDARYRTVQGMSSYWSCNHVLRDCTFKGVDASPERVDWGNAGPRDYRVQWSLTIRAPAQTDVTVTNKAGETCFKGRIGSMGCVRVPLAAFRMSNKTTPNKTPLTPHTLVAKPPQGQAVTETLTMDRRQVHVVPGAPEIDTRAAFTTISARRGTELTVKDDAGNEFIKGTIGCTGSIAVPLKNTAGKPSPYVVSGLHADGETFQEPLLLNTARIYTVPHSQKSMKALVAREKGGKKGKKRSAGK